MGFPSDQLMLFFLFHFFTSRPFRTQSSEQRPFTRTCRSLSLCQHTGRGLAAQEGAARSPTTALETAGARAARVARERVGQEAGCSGAGNEAARQQCCGSCSSCLHTGIRSSCVTSRSGEAPSSAGVTSGCRCNYPPTSVVTPHWGGAKQGVALVRGMKR